MLEILENSGIDMGTLVLLLLFPVATSFIGISRHIIGFRSLGIYLSLLMTFLLYQLGVSNGDSIYSDPLLGIRYGLVLFILVFGATFLAYRLTRKWTLHYYPKLSVIITLVTLIIISVITFLSILNIRGLLNINLFTLILILGLTEKFISILVRKKIRPTMIIALESVIQAILCYLLISFKPLIDFLIQYPYAILLLFPLNYFVGRFAGLRLTEYYRFRKILNGVE